ncbi:hypothetical protein L3X38_041450 [Prunus dulcis]|uniref:ADP-ribosyl cyclase/cyclic ADP-ribose hydrolase n=1 Tax=Prunus dulcis TaxID=3755 RepID=A0AAD4YJ76_PRUDU|nr:hypothetical protein L3X38_041450 [Prunus dulcis]
MRGIGGIGKTTIAKLVYDSISTHFESSSFLANVREVSQRGCLVDLQRQLLSPILKDQITQVWDEQWGTNFIKNCLSNKKVLLILDDVSESSQLEKLAGEKDWFGKGSIIIITTRDERLLVKHDMQVSYKVEGLSDDDALELFSRNAFKKNEHDEGFLELSKGFVNYARGLPLALKLLGGLMYKRDEDEWESELDKLRKISKSEIIDLLKISYDGLDEMNKDIFLDVAFFHNGKDKEEVIEILDSCGLCGCVGINDLVQKSLLAISHRNVEMHDLIQEMALEIVRRECPDEPGRRSRLCNYDDIFHVFINNTATNKIRGISLRTATVEKTNWNCEAFSKMLNLKFLEFDNMMISSSPGILPNSLKSIKWSRYPSKFLPSGQMKNLSFLLLSGTSIEKLSSSIGCLVGLTNLFLMDCENLAGLPSEICNLKSLACLNASGCSTIDKLPENMGDMEFLCVVQLDGTSIRQLPRSTVSLKKLGYLYLGGRSGSQRDKSRFRWLLPRLYERNALVLSSFDGLCSLKILNLSDYGLCEGDLPSDIDCLCSLVELKLSGNNFVSLPASVGCLCNLASLWVNGCQSLEQLPDLSKLISLVDINIADCTSLKILPHLSSNCSLVHVIYDMRFKCDNCFVLVDNEGCDSIILKMLQRYLQLQPQLQTRLQPQLHTRVQVLQISIPGRKIPEWFSNQSSGDSLTMELPTTWMGIALCAVFEVQAHLSDFQYFQISCSAQGLLPHGVFSKYFKIGDVVYLVNNLRRYAVK